MVFQWIRLCTTTGQRSEGSRLRHRLRRARHRRRVAPGLNAVRTMERTADDGERSNFASYLNGLRQGMQVNDDTVEIFLEFLQQFGGLGRHYDVTCQHYAPMSAIKPPLVTHY